ncbi:uncharacterized protein TA10590 [Theileria annulata]|uniref:Uncharacterized protein n=1 Tax=Theileria annulata TaxID=5874 RepID=Q4U917_THEAN|nr:uncharacterized protein TA10590 [Theileria annulata]CAI76686.1 hypothetical protein TA10590 [Theileria annulata]|eukprot:XP_953311.1 hypothetical protein TA10590 [Theileria annulata]
MMSVKKIKVVSTIANLISIGLASCLFVFCYYLVASEKTKIGLIVVDTYFGSLAIAFALFSLYSILKEELSFLVALRTYYGISACFMVTISVVHTLIPIYSEFDDELYTTENMYYLAATAYILGFIQNIYSLYLCHSLIQHKRIELENEDFDTLGEGKSCSSLNITTDSKRLGVAV